MSMYQMVYNESTVQSFESKREGSIFDRALKSFNRYGYLAQEGFELHPCKYLQNRWELQYKGKFYDRYNTLDEAIIMYLEFVASIVMSHKSSKKKSPTSHKIAIDESDNM